MSRKHRHKRQSPAGPAFLAAPLEELTAIVAKAEVELLSAEESAKLKAALALIGFLRTELQSKKTQKKRLLFTAVLAVLLFLFLLHFLLRFLFLFHDVSPF